MTPETSPIHRARYDDDGNIILVCESRPTIHTPNPAVVTFLVTNDAEEKTEAESETINLPVDSLQWGLTDEPPEDISHLPTVERENVKQRVKERLATVRTSCAAALSEAEHTTAKVMHQLLSEGEQQVKTGIEASLHTSTSVLAEVRSILRAFSRFVTQPVLVPSRKKTMKHYSRGTLSALDIVRFGGTFAAIFAVLFSAMNYESFIAIASARIEPILAFTNLDESASVQRSLASKLRQAPSLPTAGTVEGTLTAHVPPVGPPEDLLIIPKLNLHAPIVTISTDSLVREDWKQLETDIQHGLERGVVHYPGSAEPGQAGNFFITGHSSYFPWADGHFKSVFARLGELSVGDEFWVYHGGDKYRYIIDSTKEILPSDVSVLDQPVGKRMATMMTCTPVGTTLRRLIISATEVDPVTGEPMDVGAHQQQTERPAIKLDALPI